MHHGSEFTVILVICVALLIGAVTRFFGSRIKLPYTVAMLLLGLGLGWVVHAYAGEVDPEHGLTLLQRLDAATGLSPDLIVFVFLPALIFESAFGLDVHTFRKSLGAVIVLAVPALIASTALTAGMATLIVPEAWGWDLTACLVFGVLISATDPVAVVSLMRSLGVSKRLSTLIEGESLLNDGTAIVGFTVLLKVLTDPTTTMSFAGVGGQFLVVVAGGLAVGLILSLVTSWWLGRTFNDPLIEITLTILVCYVAMFVAEGMLHVSGVMAIVLAGLWMSGPGRTRISPDVMHFLHRFWEMLAFIANTLVFFLVGLVVGSQLSEAVAQDFVIILIAYAGIMLIRGVVTFAARPLANLFLKDKISAADGLVASWGGLRGAVSMALALIVLGEADQLPAGMNTDKMLLVSAGVVLLSIVVNGTTMGALLRKFGYDKPPLSDQLAQASAQVTVLENVETELRGRSRHRMLRTVRWGDVLSDVHTRRDKLTANRDRLANEVTQAPAAEQAAGFWRQVLGMERGAYWSAFKSGTLSGPAVQALNQEINLQEDLLSRGSLESPETRFPPLGPWAAWVRRTVRANASYGKHFANIEFENLTMLYDISRGEAAAAKVVLGRLAEIDGMDPAVKAEIESTYKRYLRQGTERVEEMRIHLPELTQAIETRVARRVALNLEREGYEHLGHEGAIGHDDAERLVHHVEQQMAKLALAPRSLPIPETHALLSEVPLFQPLGEVARKKLASDATRLVVPPGEYVFRQFDKGDSMFVVVRGAAEVLLKADAEGEETLVDVVGGGEIVGEMALLTGEPRTASIRASTALTLVKINRETFDALMQQQEGVRDEIWVAFAERRFANHVRGMDRFGHLDAAALTKWVHDSPHVSLAKGESHTVPADAVHAFLLTGAARVDGKGRAAPAFLPDAAGHTIEATVDARIVLLPAPPA